MSNPLIGFSVNPRQNCPHVQIKWINIFNELLDTLGKSILPGVCKECSDQSQNWMCLVCNIVYCSRYVKGHMAEHNKQTNHQVAFSFSDASFWCYSCDDYITNMPMNLCRNKFSSVKFPNGEDEQEYMMLSEKFGKIKIQEPPKYTYQDFIDGVKTKKYKNIVFMTGAGISVSAGIPDFRTPGTGLYSKLKETGLTKPEDVFTLQYFKQNQEPFYKLSKQFSKATIKPVISHKFIKKVNDEGILSRVLTQNIDGLQLNAGLPEQKLFQAHGHSRSAHCVSCKKQIDINLWNNAVQTGIVLKCVHQPCQGLVKPDIVFFGEALPKEFHECPEIVQKADLVIIMGTSLLVFPFAFLTQMVQPKTPIVLINNTNSLSNKHKNKLWLDGDLDARVKQIVDDLKWEI